jgi:hypothetical protein
MASEPDGPRVPPEIARFLTAHIGSVEELELLLLLHRGRERAWTAEEAARALYANPQSIARRLAKLHRSGLVASADAPGASGASAASAAFRFAPADPELSTLVDRLDDVYRERRVAVITLLASQPLENIRAFADAFRLGRKGND